MLNLALVSLAAVSPASDRPALGDPPPPLGLEHRLQWPEGAPVDWEGLRGKVVVLEFWGTWCPPCVAAIPHLNELAEQFDGADVRFVAISFEEPEVVRSFLERRPMRSWIGLDTDRSVSEAFGIGAYPTTVLVDRTGRIAAYTSPEVVTPRVLRAMLAGESPPIHVRDATTVDPGVEANELEPLFEVSIRPSTGRVTGFRTDPPGTFTTLGQSLSNILSAAYDVSWTRTRVDVELPGDRYDVRVHTPPEMEERLLHEALESTFGFRTRRIEEEVDAFALRVTDATAKLLQPSKSGEWSSSSGARGFGATGCSLADLARMLENRLDTPVFDETGIAGLFDFELQLSSNGTGDVAAALRGQFGLELATGRRRISLLVLEPPEGVEAPPEAHDY